MRNRDAPDAGARKMYPSQPGPHADIEWAYCGPKDDPEPLWDGTGSCPVDWRGSIRLGHHPDLPKLVGILAATFGPALVVGFVLISVGAPLLWLLAPPVSALAAALVAEWRLCPPKTIGDVTGARPAAQPELPAAQPARTQIDVHWDAPPVHHVRVVSTTATDLPQAVAGS